MRMLLRPLMWLSLMGILVSLTMHIRTLFGHIPSNEIARILLIGLCLLQIPSLYVTAKLTGGWLGSHRMWEALGNCPRWVRSVIRGLLAYTFVIAAVGYFRRTGGPQFVTALCAALCAHSLGVFYSAILAGTFRGRDNPKTTPTQRER